MTSEKEKNSSGIRPFLMLITVGVVYFFCNFHRFSLGVISGVLTEEFALNHIRLGLLGSAFFYSYALMQILSGLLTDKLGSRLIMTLSCLLTAAATFWFASAEGFPGLFSSSTLTGLAVAFVYVPALAVVREWFNEKIFSTMTGVLVAMGQLGSLSSSVPLHLAVSSLGWRGTFRIIAYVSIALFVLVWLIVRSSPPGNKAPERKEGTAAWESSKEVFKKPAFWSIVCFFFISGGVQLSFQGLWGARFFDLALGRESEKAALLMVISSGCIAGAMLLGFLADRLGRFRVLVGIGFAFAILWLLMSSLGFSSNPVTLYFLCFVFGILGAGSYTVAFSVIRYFSVQGNGGLLTGINGCAGFLGGAIFTQMAGVFFNFSQAGIAAGFRVVFLVFAAVCVLGTLLMMRLNKSMLGACRA